MRGEFQIRGADTLRRARVRAKAQRVGKAGRKGITTEDTEGRERELDMRAKGAK
jgi:hypothetical protein